MKSSNEKAVKIIGLIMTGVLLIGGVVQSGLEIKESARNYTDEKTEKLRQEQMIATKELKEDISEMKKDTAVIRTIIEERFTNRTRR